MKIICKGFINPKKSETNSLRFIKLKRKEFENGKDNKKDNKRVNGSDNDCVVDAGDCGGDAGE